MKICGLRIQILEKRWKNGGLIITRLDGLAIDLWLNWGQIRSRNKDIFGNLNEKKKSILDQIEKLDLIEEPQQLEERVRLRASLLEVTMNDHRRLNQKCKIKWTREGDENNMFFHK